MAVYTCNEGYNMYGTDTRVCEGGIWSESAPICRTRLPCQEDGTDKCNSEILIPTCGGLGGISPFGSDSLETNLHGSSNQILTNISIHHNGSVDFNGGCLSIAAFHTGLSDSGCAHFIYDFDNNDTLPYVTNQRNHIMDLLDATYFDDDTVTNFFVVTWKDYTYCGTHTISFQLAIASTLTATYAVFLYDGDGECNHMPPVITGFKTGCGVGSVYHHPILVGENVSALWNTSNIQKDGVFIYKISTITPTQPRCSNLIPVSDHYGGIDSHSILINHPLQGPYQYSNQNLTMISIYHNGSVHFNNGSQTIAVFLTNLTGQDAHYLYDTSDDENIEFEYLESQRNAIIAFLDSANMPDLNVTHFIVITWKKYEYCQEKGVTFQLAIASTSSATYAVFLYCGKGRCNPDPPVIAGFNTGDSCGYWKQVLKFKNVWSLWESSNIGIDGVFVYDISKMPSGIRLDEQENDMAGLVEVCHDGKWGSVCDDYWTDVEADVACRLLGFFGYSAQARHRGRFNNAAEVVYWLDNVNCHGSENSLFECEHRGIGKHNCGRRERAGVRCTKRSHRSLTEELNDPQTNKQNAPEPLPVDPAPFKIEEHGSRYRRRTKENCDIQHILLVLDTSGSVGEDNFNRVTSFLSNLINFFCKPVKLAVMTFDHEYYIEFCFGQYDSLTHAGEVIHSIPYFRPHWSLDETRWTHTAGAAQCVCNYTLSPSCGLSPEAECVDVIFFTDGRANDPTLDICEEIHCLHRRTGVDTFALGVGSYDLLKMECYAENDQPLDNYHLFNFETFNELYKQFQIVLERLQQPFAEDSHSPYLCADTHTDPTSTSGDGD